MVIPNIAMDLLVTITEFYWYFSNPEMSSTHQLEQSCLHFLKRQIKSHKKDCVWKLVFNATAFHLMGSRGRYKIPNSSFSDAFLQEQQKKCWVKCLFSHQLNCLLRLIFHFPLYICVPVLSCLKSTSVCFHLFYSFLFSPFLLGKPCEVLQWNIKGCSSVSERNGRRCRGVNGEITVEL